uniref:non-specific serine/threonine protein kinase n=1 Tax=Dugesia japonica TaxID=6161 RepID=A0A8F2IFI0_DUGJA|nr:serine/threonine kinase ATG1-3 [Dugesia japonica]
MFTPTLPNYVFCEKLGKGTNATVFKAHKKGEINKAVAVKCINKKVLNKTGSDNLVSEISILKELCHEYIVQLLDFTWDSNFIYLILEYCPGGDLYSYIKKHTYLDEPVVHRFLQQLALALQFLYQKSILHMDLKPPNILLTSSIRPKLKLADFGFAKCIEGTVNMDFLRGSLLYMAPEVYLSGTYSAKCDLWSVGVIIYECLIGKAPFYSNSLDELKSKIIDKNPVIIPYETPTGIPISENCVALMSGLLQRNFDDRLSYEEFLNHKFVDIEHSPSNKSLSISLDILQIAKAEEDRWRERYTNSSIGPRERRIANVMELRRIYENYLDGLSHMLAAINYETSETKRNSLKEIMSEKFNQVELLQQELNSLNSDFSKPMSNEDNLNILERECYDNELLSENVEQLRKFYELIEHNHLKIAIDKFTNIFESSYSLIKEDTNVPRKQLFYKELEYAMSVAENAKALMKNTDMKSLKKHRDSINGCVIS